jgi:hypothetical protein
MRGSGHRTKHRYLVLGYNFTHLYRSMLGLQSWRYRVFQNNLLFLVKKFRWKFWDTFLVGESMYIKKYLPWTCRQQMRLKRRNKSTTLFYDTSQKIVIFIDSYLYIYHCKNANNYSVINIWILQKFFCFSGKFAISARDQSDCEVVWTITRSQQSRKQRRVAM